MPARDVLKPRVPVQLGNQPEDVKAPRRPEADPAAAATGGDEGPRVADMLKQMRAELPAGQRAEPSKVAAAPGEASVVRPAPASPAADRAMLEQAAAQHLPGALPPLAGRYAGQGPQADVFEPPPQRAHQLTPHELEGMLFDPRVFGSRQDRARAMTPERRQAILEKALGLLPKLLRYNPRNFNNYRPGTGDHVDHAPGTVQSYLRNTAMTLMQGASPGEQKRLMPLLKEIFGRLQEFDSQVKPPKAAARPGRELNYRLGSQMPDHPMVLPVEL